MSGVPGDSVPQQQPRLHGRTAAAPWASQLQTYTHKIPACQPPLSYTVNTSLTHTTMHIYKHLTMVGMQDKIETEADVSA